MSNSTGLTVKDSVPNYRDSKRDKTENTIDNKYRIVKRYFDNNLNNSKT